MTAPKEHASLAAALVAFQSELPKVSKGRTVNTGSFSYKYADLATITEIVLPVLTKHGLSFTTRPRFNAESGGYELVGVLLHTSGESVEGSLPLHGRSPQEVGSALSYARRYLVSALTGLVADDDDDGQAANKATRTQAEPVKDWGAVIDTASGMSTVEELRGLWTVEGIGKAPKAVQDTIKVMVADAENRA
jgi:hypothetical protein